MLISTLILWITVFILDAIVLSQPLDYPDYGPRPPRPLTLRIRSRKWRRRFQRQPRPPQPPWDWPEHPEFIPPPPVGPPIAVVEAIPIVEEESILIPPVPLFNSPEIQHVISSLNSRTDAFSKPGEGYENVIAILKSHMEQKSGVHYDPVALKITPTDVRNELTANEKVAGIFYETDIALTLWQASRILGNQRRFKRKIVTNPTMRWETPVIAYRFAINDDHWEVQIRNVLAKFSQNTCLRFVENMDAEDYLIFNRGVGCYSPVGRLGGAQEISIGYGCELDGIIGHEVGHSLGLWHEHSRPERDNYVYVYVQNVLPGTQGQFQKLSRDESVDLGVPYDYGSIMHYASTTFTNSAERKTIVPRQPEYEHTMGNRVDASFLDYKILNKAYCSNICRNNLPCQHGGYVNPNACDRCLCPIGLGGTYCERVQYSSCGGELPMATNEWKNLSYSGSSNCYWRITTHPGERIHFELTYVYFKCSPICEEFVEVKFGFSHDRTGYRLCCRSEYGPMISHGNSVLVITRATVLSQFVLRYRREIITTSTRTPPTTPYSGLWSTWSPWSVCSEKCGACGKRTRGRECTGGVCYGSARETEMCGREACRPGSTVDGGVSSNYSYQSSLKLPSWCCNGFKLTSENLCIPIKNG